MISDSFVIFAIAAVVAIAAFIVWIIRTQKIRLIHKLYLSLSISYIIWILALVAMKFVNPADEHMLYILDAVTNTAGPLCPTLYLFISVSFLKNFEKLPRPFWLLCAVDIINALVVWTNPLHHLQYRVFSVIRSEVVFGPYMIISVPFYYGCLVVAVVMMLNFAFKNRSSRIYIWQTVLFAMGGLVPLLTSVATILMPNCSITTTSVSFIVTILTNGIVIYKLHMLDLKPMATQLMLDSMTDCYLILSDNGMIISYNRPFQEVIASRYGLKERGYLKDFRPTEETRSNNVIYNLMAAVDSCRESKSVISYEQPLISTRNEMVVKDYYIAEVSPVISGGQLAGFMVILKDVTRLQNSMQKLQDSQARLMEQERLAFLGQMIGGLAHNLKTPIMSISGCIESANSLVDECRESLDDPEVVREDYLEIYGELEDWLHKMQESTAYMSEIITVIKGQATTAANTESAVFTVDELFKRVALLMRHALYSAHHQLVVEDNGQKDTTIVGDINNLVQVLDNFVSNAIQAQKQPGDIVLGVSRDRDDLKIYVKDRGPGVSPQAQKRLFKEMFTTKGIHGTGLGLYISQAVIHGNFGGSLWYEDNPGGGAVFGMTIPLKRQPSADRSTTKGELK